MLLYQILEFTIHKKNIKKSYKNNKLKVSAQTWNEDFQLPDSSLKIQEPCIHLFLINHLVSY